MGIYIKNMKMPRTCARCRFFEPCSIACYVTDYFLDRDDYRFERDKDCPLIEISKSHGDLIDRDELRTKYSDFDYLYHINDAQVIIAKEEDE